jgi:hypothetical protein
MCIQHLLMTNHSHSVGICLRLRSEMVLRALNATA